MKLKLDDQGHAVIQDGKPVFVHDDGKEVAIDVPCIGAVYGGVRLATRAEAKAMESRMYGIFVTHEACEERRQNCEHVRHLEGEA